jgi:hypothetical protein
MRLDSFGLSPFGPQITLLNTGRSHCADVHRMAAIVERQMTNEEQKVYHPPPAEAVSIFQD